MGLKRDVREKWWSLSRGKRDGGGGTDDETEDEAEVSSMAEAVEMKKKVTTVSCRRFAMNWGFVFLALHGACFLGIGFWLGA